MLPDRRKSTSTPHPIPSQPQEKRQIKEAIHSNWQIMLSTSHQKVSRPPLILSLNTKGQTKGDKC